MKCGPKIIRVTFIEFSYFFSIVLTGWLLASSRYYSTCYDTLFITGKGLTPLKRLKVLRLDGNHLLKIEPRELSGCAQLTSLDIGGNKLDSISVSKS